MSQRLLMVEDDAAFRRLYGKVLRAEGIEVDEADDRPSGDAALARHRYPVVLLDMMLPPDGSARAGLEQLARMRKAAPHAKIIVASGAGDTALMIDAIGQGAYDFLTKPVDPDVLLIVVQRAFAVAALETQIEGLQDSLTQAAPADRMVGSSPAFERAVLLGERVAPSDLPVLITGESGTGKELMARAVHRHSRRHNKPFVVVNCGGLPETLLESALFGHVRGAFTGAHRDRPGLFVEADGGTLFLDEIGDMPPALQVKLLRTLESGEVLPVGADRPVQVDVRLISATHRDVQALADEGAFREDLYWRVRGAEIRLPPLRERPRDIAVLAEHFLNRAAHFAHDGQPRRLSPEARAACEAHPWPGNLRELRHEMQRATVLSGARTVIDAIDLELRQPRTALAMGTLADQVEALERRLIAEALADHQGNRTRAAQQLGLSRQGLLKKMGRFGLG
jgi:DNA-binding NtrC family response regulator